MIIEHAIIKLPDDFPFSIYESIHEPLYTMGEVFHWHDCFELSFAKSGSGTYYIEDREYPIEKGEMVVINNVEPHRMQADAGGLTQLIITFNPSLIWSGAKDLLDYNYMKAFIDRGIGFSNKISKNNPYFSDVNKLVLEIDKEYGEKLTGFQLMIKAKLLELLTLLYRHFKSDNNNQGQRQLLLRMQPVIMKIERNISLPYAFANEIKRSESKKVIERIDSKSYADILHVTPQHFSVLFKDAMGSNFSDYIISRKISLVKEKLLTTNSGITEIALGCGFHNLSHFNLTFKKLTGTTPSEFRNKKN